MVKRISENELRYLAGKKGFNLIYLEKDYFLTLLLYLTRNIRSIYLKGGTALNKILLNHVRLSEDLDFSTKGSLESVQGNILRVLNENKNIFFRYAFDNRTSSFFRLKIFYKSYFSEKDHIIVDVNKKSTIYLDTKEFEVPHFYEEIPRFKISIINPDEIIAEKVRALMTRNQPRDYFDVYMILKADYSINYDLVKKKLEDVGEEFDVRRIFRNARKIYSYWDNEVNQLTNSSLDYEEMMKKLQKEFEYKK
ncbi:MAG: nucleotidyl transferase AbiEii/AbiGii toxin family protein [Candidatus Aenigmarchaeota archaeon]|nr:nucleotidyl transferase AbiEii/AbiGii toxin family protein [Candidatus Aenigmarchaeota archaeon]